MPSGIHFKKLKCCLSLRGAISSLLLVLFFVPSGGLCWDSPFDNASNWGGTGLMETPTARILDDGVVRISAAQALPYRWFSGGLGVFPGLEASGRLTVFTNIPSEFGSSYGSSKDKAFDLKYQVLPESKWFPALAVGWHDFHGTKLFEAQYIVLSRQYFPFDFTLGYGTKRLDGLFGGIEVSLHPRLNLLAEYNPIRYEKDRAGRRPVPEGARWPVNFGLRYKALYGVEIGLSYQRGDAVGVMLNLQVPLGVPILPHASEPPPQLNVDRTPFSERDRKEMIQKIHDALHDTGFSNISVYTDGENLGVEFTNNQYLSDQKAVGRALRALLFHSPADTRKLEVLLKRNAMPIVKISVKPKDFEAFIFGEMTEEAFLSVAEVELEKQALQSQHPEALFLEGNKERLTYGIKPGFTTFLNDPSGFFKFRAGIKPWAEMNPWEGGRLHARYDIPFYSNISSSNLPAPDAVREDSWKYLGDDLSFESLMFDQAVRFSDRVFGRISFGYLETMYAGGGGEVLYFPGDGRVALGIESEWVRKREPGSQFDLMAFDYYDFLGNIYYRIPSVGLTLHAQYGRFLAGDVGFLFNVSRQYSTGAIVGAWLGLTDTDDLQGFSRGYDSKGVFLSIPAKFFMTHDSPLRYDYAVAPWTRDSAATVYKRQTLFDLVSDLAPASFKAKSKELKD